MINISTSIFSSASIDEYVREIQEFNKSELIELVNSIEIVQQESEMFCKEINALTDEIPVSPSLESSNILKRVDIVLGFIELTLGKDVLALPNKAHQKLLNLQDKIIKLYNVCKQVRKEIEYGFSQKDTENWQQQVNNNVSNEMNNDLREWDASDEEGYTNYWDYVPGWDEELELEFLSHYEEVAATVELEKIIDNPNKPLKVGSSTENAGIKEETTVFEPTESKQSKDKLRQKINAVRDKYLINKIAGKDLFDTQGVCIIRKNGTITESVIDKAFNEGKLADLIINMESIEQED